MEQRSWDGAVVAAQAAPGRAVTRCPLSQRCCCCGAVWGWLSALLCVPAAGCGVLLQSRALQRAVAAASELHALGGHFPLHPHLWNVFCLPVVSTCPSQPRVCVRAQGQEDLRGIDTICFGGLFSSAYFTASHSVMTLLLPRPFCYSIPPGNSCNGAT